MESLQGPWTQNPIHRARVKSRFFQPLLDLPYPFLGIVLRLEIGTKVLDDRRAVYCRLGQRGYFFTDVPHLLVAPLTLPGMTLLVQGGVRR